MVKMNNSPVRRGCAETTSLCAQTEYASIRTGCATLITIAETCPMNQPTAVSKVNEGVPSTQPFSALKGKEGVHSLPGFFRSVECAKICI